MKQVRRESSGLDTIIEGEYEGKYEYREPRIVTIQEDDGARILNKNNINNLPYMHRKPRSITDLKVFYSSYLR